MDVKKAIISGAILYAVIFLIMTTVMIAMPSVWAISQTYLGMILSVILAYLLASNYYFKTKPTNPLIEGLKLGVAMVIVGVVLDIPIMVYGFAAEQGWGYLSTWHLIVGYLLTIISPVAAAHMKK